MTVASDLAAVAAHPGEPSTARAPAWPRLLHAARPLAQHRLFQFAVIGGLLFAVAPRPRSPRDIEIEGERLAALHAAEAARAGSRTLPGERAREVDERALEDEILYREGVRLGLDQNDGIVRQRVVQKVLFLAEEIAGASRPADDAGLRAFFADNRERWAIPEHHRFTQIYRHAPDALAAWAAGPRTDEPPPGEPAPVGTEIDGDEARLTTSLGASFAAAVAAAQVGTWVGPVRSAFGWHLVRVIEHRPARPAQLEEVRQAVAEAYSVHRRQEAIAAFLTSAFARYHVTVDGQKVSGITPSRRIAFRSVSSGED